MRCNVNAQRISVRDTVPLDYHRANRKVALGAHVQKNSIRVHVEHAVVEVGAADGVEDKVAWIKSNKPAL